MSSRSAIAAAPSTRRWLLYCVLAAAALRIAVLVALRQWRYAFYEDNGTLAVSLLGGQGYSSQPGYYWFTDVSPTAMIAPFQTLFTVVFYWLFGIRTTAAHAGMQIAQSVVSALCVVPIYRIGEKLFSERAGRIAALLFVFYPPFIFLTLKLCSSTWATFVLLWIIYVTLQARDAGSWSPHLLLGALWGVMFLLYPTVAIFAVTSFLWLLWTARKDGAFRMASRLAVSTGLSLVIVAPWSIRNYLAFHRFIPFTSGFSYNLFMGNNELATGSQTGFLPVDGVIPNAALAERYPFIGRLRGMNDEVAVQALFDSSARAFVHEHPGAAARLFLVKLRDYWWFTPYHHTHGSSTEYLYMVSYVALLAFTFWGIAALVRERRLLAEVALLALLAIPVSFVYAETSVGMARFRTFIEPAFMPFAALGVAMCIDRAHALWARR